MDFQIKSMYDSQRTDDGHSAAAAARKTQFLSISIEVLYVRFFSALGFGG